MDEKGYWIDVARKRRSRRWLLTTAAVATGGAAATLAVGCGDDDDDDDGAAKATGTVKAATGPKKGGTFVLPIGTSFNDVFDPHISGFQAAFIYDFIGNTAVRLSPDGTKIEPELVEKWEIPGDGTQVLLQVRQGVKWHNKPPTNGRALDTQDVAYNLMRIAAKLNPDQAARFQRRSTLQGMTAAEAVDAKTVRVTFDKPVSSFLNGLTDYRNQLFPRDFLDQGGKFENADALVGSGPFVIESLRNQERAVFKRNPDYWNKEQPFLDGVEWAFIQDPLAMVTALSQGRVHMLTDASKAQRAAIRQTTPSAREETWAFANRNVFRFNTTRKPFGDPRVRRALQLAIDFKKMNDATLEEKYWDYVAMFPATFPEAISSADVAKLPGWNPSTKQQDIKTANDLMSSAGFPNGDIAFKIMAYPAPGSALADFPVRLLDQWKTVWPNMKAEIEIAADAATFNRRQAGSDFDAYVFLEYSFPDAALDMAAHFASDGGRNYGKFSDKQVDDLIAKAGAELDKTKRKDALLSAQKLLIEQHMPLFQLAQPRSVVYFDKKVEGMSGYGLAIGGGATHDTYVFLRQGGLSA